MDHSYPLEWSAVALFISDSPDTQRKPRSMGPKRGGSSGVRRWPGETNQHCHNTFASVGVPGNAIFEHWMRVLVCGHVATLWNPRSKGPLPIISCIPR